MNELLTEFLSEILTEEQVIAERNKNPEDEKFDNTVITYTFRDKKTNKQKEGEATIKTIKTRGSSHPGWPKYQQMLKSRQKKQKAQPQQKKVGGKIRPQAQNKNQKAQPTQSKKSSGKSDKSGQRIISGKNKTLQKVNTTKSKEFNREPQPSDTQFAKKNKGFQIGPPPPRFKMPNEVFKGAKVPKRHLKALERMMNTRATSETAKWTHFSDIPGGAGQISAQAGELMTLISTTLDEKAARIFFDTLLQHEQNQVSKNKNLEKEGTRIVTKSWIQAARNNRRAILNRIQKEYPNSQIVAGAWDSENEVTAMGLSDYKKNKGFSTDAYFKIKTADGQEILDEVSLKKSTAVNFLNSGTGKLLEWDPNIPDNINPNVYSNNQRKDLLNFGKKNLTKLKRIAGKDKDFKAIMKAKKLDLDTALSQLEKGKGSRTVNKIVLSAIKILASKGDAGAKKYLKDVDTKHRKHQTAVIDALGTNKKLKQGMLGAIREEFPLKAVGEGEESMAIGPYSLDRSVLESIFDTSDFEQIKQGLFAVTDEEPPYLAYKAGKKGRIVPIATIVAREDGVGYGGSIKFEMQLDKRFAKILDLANKKVYGGDKK